MLNLLKDPLTRKYENIQEYAQTKEKLLRGEKMVMVKNLPVEVSIEVSKRCNIHCRMCTQPIALKETIKTYGTAHLDFNMELYRKVECFLPQAIFFFLVGIGEPLISRDYFSILKASSKYVLFSWTYTNGLLLTPERIKVIIASGLTRITVSISAGSNEKYAEIHKGGKMEELLENIAQFAAIKKELNVSSPELSVNFVAMKDNIQELPLLVKRLAPYGIGTIEVKPEARITEGSFTNTSTQIDPVIIRETEQLAEGAGIIVNWYHYDVSQSRKKPFQELGICLQAFRTIHINTLGNVYPCCAGETLGRDSLILGNLYEQSFEEIWNGKKIQKLRRRLIEKEYLPACKECISSSLNTLTTDQFDECANFNGAVKKAQMVRNALKL
jgi:radical SAM protein with 4Fe4S-binding SPASM domain